MKSTDTKGERGGEAPRGSRWAGEEKLRVKEQKTRKRGRQQANVVHEQSKPRPEDPEHPDNTPQETTRASKEKSQNPTITQKTRSRSSCLKPNGVRFKCTGCPKEYPNAYNRSRHEKKQHQNSYLAAKGNLKLTATDREGVSDQAGRRPTAYKPGNFSRGSHGGHKLKHPGRGQGRHGGGI